MDNIISFYVENKKIFYCPQTGTFSFNVFNCSNIPSIDYDTICELFEPKFLTICLSISNACNLSCDYCFNKNKNGLGMNVNLAIDMSERMINKFNKCEKFFVDLSGYGEPLLFLDTILAINEFCKNKSNELNVEILVSFVSNGTLLTKEIAKILQNKGVLFGVSLDGNKYVHDLHRKNIKGEKTYDSIITNIESIENKEYVGCAITITNEVFDLENTICDLLKHFKTISIKPVRSSNKNICFTKVKEWISEYDKLTNRIVSDFSKNNTKIIKALLNGDDYFGKFIYRCFIGSVTINRCDAGITRYSFTNDGECYGCPSLSMNSVNKITDIGKYKERFRKQVLDTRMMCDNCEFLLICGGECSCEYLEIDGINQYMCSFKKNLIKRAMYIKLICQNKYNDIFRDLLAFCYEKKNRYKKIINWRNFYVKLSIHLSKERRCLIQ